MSPEERYYASSDEGEIKRSRTDLEVARGQLKHWQYLKEHYHAQAREFRSLLECTEFALEWFFERFDDPKFFRCDCSDGGGYMEWDTNAYIHTEKCSSGMGDSMGALRDQIRQALRTTARPEEG